MNTCALILAKASSKRLPNKNTLDFNGRPMWQVNAEKCMEIFDKVFISTDDYDVFIQAMDIGAFPIQRPPMLCGDCPNIPVYQHAMLYMDEFDGVVAVQANSPTIDPFTIATAKRVIEEGDLGEVMTCHEGGDIYGSVWALTFEKLANYGDPYKPMPLVTIVDPSIDIHTPEDYKLALKQKLYTPVNRQLLEY